MTEPTHRNVRAIASRAVRDDRRARRELGQKIADARKLKGGGGTLDSFVNFQHNLGIGADNILSSSTYGFNPVSRVRTLLEWVHRGSWIGGMAVDVVADDMTREGIELRADLDPGAIKRIEEAAVALNVWGSINEVIKWGRLYGGCLGFLMIEGQDAATPLRLETVGRDQFRGILPLDRWMVEPSLENLVTEPGPNIGMPRFYTITADAPALPRLRIHHSRVIRIIGVQLPYWQRLTENLWGISVLERLYDRMVSFDLATTGAAQLVGKSYVRTYKVKNLREIISAGGPALTGLTAYIDMMRRFQGIEGMTVMDGEDEFEATQHAAFGGLSDVLLQFGQQLSGALQIPLVRLFGQSPAGLNSTGESDLRTYYDGIKQQQQRMLGRDVVKVYRCLSQSIGIALPEGFEIEFRSLWQMSDQDKAAVSKSTVEAVVGALDAGLVSPRVAMQELRASADTTGMFSNISDEDIEQADDVAAPPEPEMLPAMPGMPTPGAKFAKAGEQQGAAAEAKAAAGDPKAQAKAPGGAPPKPVEKPAKEGAKDAKRRRRAIDRGRLFHGLDCVIETAAGELRRGVGDDGPWEVRMPIDYGYIRGTGSAEGADEQLDCFLSADAAACDGVFVINQGNLDGSFDEHKVMLGYRDALGAIKDYCRSFSDGKGAERILSVEPSSVQQLLAWIAGGDYGHPFVGGEQG
jgi:uncharacterized protein